MYEYLWYLSHCFFSLLLPFHPYSLPSYKHTFTFLLYTRTEKYDSLLTFLPLVSATYLLNLLPIITSRCRVQTCILSIGYSTTARDNDTSIYFWTRGTNTYSIEQVSRQSDYPLRVNWYTNTPNLFTTTMCTYVALLLFFNFEDTCGKGQRWLMPR